MEKNALRILGSVALVSLACTACDRSEEKKDAKSTETTATAKPSIDDVKDDPSRYYGKRITLSGEVDGVTADDRAFTLEGSQWIFPDKITVLTRSPVKMAGKALAKDDHVQVTGTVRRYVREDVKRELGWDLSPELDVKMREKPVLVADEIRRMDATATWTAQKPEGEIVSVFTMVTAFSPEALVGQSVTLERQPIQSIAGKGVFIGTSPSSETFVLAPNGAVSATLKKGDLVDVQGKIAKTPPAADAMKTWNLPADARTAIEHEPLFVNATRLEPSKSTAPNGAPKTAEAKADAGTKAAAAPATSGADTHAATPKPADTTTTGSAKGKTAPSDTKQP